MALGCPFLSSQIMTRWFEREVVLVRTPIVLPAVYRGYEVVCPDLLERIIRHGCNYKAAWRAFEG